MIPLNNNVIVKRNEIAEKSAGGIVLPGNDEKPTTGTVVASATSDLSVGDIVVFGKYAGKEMKIGNDTMLIIPFKEILVKLC